MFSKVEFLVATGRRVALGGWRFDIGTYWLLKGCNYSFLDLRRGGHKCMFEHFWNQDWKIFLWLTFWFCFPGMARGLGVTYWFLSPAAAPPVSWCLLSFWTMPMSFIHGLFCAWPPMPPLCHMVEAGHPYTRTRGPGPTLVRTRLKRRASALHTCGSHRPPHSLLHRSTAAAPLTHSIDLLLSPRCKLYGLVCNPWVRVDVLMTSGLARILFKCFFYCI